VPTRFTPSSSTFSGKQCGGVQIYLDDWSRFEALPVGLTIAATLRKLHPRDWQTARYNALLANTAVHAAMEKGEPASRLLQMAEPALQAFRRVRARYLLYR
jgi:uncharacterized protein YbbC (DUF1343 family)